MSLWYMKTIIETEDDYTEGMIRKQIQCDANRGDGIYIEVGKLCSLEKQEKPKEEEG